MGSSQAPFGGRTGLRGSEGCGQARLGSESPISGGIRPKCPEEIDLAEGRPVGIAEVKLRMGALPEQETAEPLLA